MHYLLKWIKFSVKKNKTLKNTGNFSKISGKVREFCQSGKVGTLTAEMLKDVKSVEATDGIQDNSNRIIC